MLERYTDLIERLVRDSLTRMEGSGFFGPFVLRGLF